MRQNLVFLILIGLFGVLAISLATRDRASHAVPLPIAPSASASTPEAPISSQSAAPSPSASAAPATSVAKLGRPLRVIGNGWETLAPIVLANGGLEPKKDSDVGKAGIEAAVRVARELDDFEAALARGGSDGDGADVAVIPLPNLVASYQKLQALRPVVVFASAWSRGREVITAKQPLDKLPASGEVHLATDGTPAASYFGLFAAELAGVAPARLRAVEPGDAKIHLSALSRREFKAADQKDVLLSTAEAVRFAPIVLVCSAAFVEKHSDSVEHFVEAWLAGAKRLASDPTTSARSISALDNAPEPITLLAALGDLVPIGLGENAELLGLSGRGAVTIDSLTLRMWRLAREAKWITVAQPERSLVVTGPVAQIVRADPSQLRAAPSADAAPKLAKGARALIVVRAPKDGAESAIGFVAGVFQRSPIRVSAAEPKLAESLVRVSSERFGLPQGRLLTGTTAARGAEAVVEVMPVP